MAESGDRLVVGYSKFVKDVSALIGAEDDHSCHVEDKVPYSDMAKELWNAGYRFDPEARIQWLIVELRSILDGSPSEMFSELLSLLGVEG